jgi:hypothetical protein
MKKIISVVIAVLVGTVAGIFLANHHERRPEAIPASIAVVEPAAPEKDSAPSIAQSQQTKQSADSAASLADTLTNQTVIAESIPAGPTNEVTAATAKLVAPGASFAEKQAIFKKLRENGKLDEAIEAVKKGAAENPGMAQYPATAGELILQKLGVMSRQGAALNEMGMLAMQSDMYFDSALKSQPDNWEAQFYKATAMAHWPLELNKGEEVVTRFSTLIDQQERGTSQPEYANTYVLLGDYYQKLGQQERANATWQLGLEKFPSDQNLTAKLGKK